MTSFQEMWVYVQVDDLAYVLCLNAIVGYVVGLLGYVSYNVTIGVMEQGRPTLQPYYVF